MINDKLIIISVLAFYQVKTWVQGSSVAVVPDRQGRAGCDAQRHQVAQALDDPILCALATAGVVTLHVPTDLCMYSENVGPIECQAMIFLFPQFLVMSSTKIGPSTKDPGSSRVIQGHPGSMAGSMAGSIGRSRCGATSWSFG